MVLICYRRYEQAATHVLTADTSAAVSRNSHLPSSEVGVWM